MDTVFEPDSIFQKFEEKDGTTTGPGAADMTGGLVITLGALKALYENHALEGTMITVSLLAMRNGRVSLCQSRGATLSKQGRTAMRPWSLKVVFRMAGRMRPASHGGVLTNGF